MSDIIIDINNIRGRMPGAAPVLEHFVAILDKDTNVIRISHTGSAETCTKFWCQVRLPLPGDYSIPSFDIRGFLISGSHHGFAATYNEETRELRLDHEMVPEFWCQVAIPDLPPFVPVPLRAREVRFHKSATRMVHHLQRRLYEACTHIRQLQSMLGQHSEEADNFFIEFGVRRVSEEFWQTFETADGYLPDEEENEEDAANPEFLMPQFPVRNNVPNHMPNQQ